MNLYILLGAAALGGALLYFYLHHLKQKKKVALDKPEYKPYKLVRKTKLSPNSYQFRFALPSPDMSLGLPIGKHVYVRAKTAQGEQSRPYTPTSSDDDKGHFDLVIKIYPTGKLTPHLEKLKEGDYVDVKGPAGKLAYHGDGKFTIQEGKNNAISKKVRKLGLIAGGTGITPMYQMITAILKNAKDKTSMSMVYGSISEDDILLRKELEAYERENKSNLKIFYVLDKPSEGWKGGSGYVSTDMISQNLPPPADDVLILMCGPPRMIEMLEQHMNTLGYNESMYFAY